MDLLAKAKSELSDIDQRIAEMVRRKNDLQAFIAAGERLFGSTPTEVESEMSPRQRLSFAIQATAQEMIAETIRASRPTKKDQITSAAFEILSRGDHMHSRDLAAHIQAMGIDLGSEPASAVSVLLSRDDRFKSERAKGGWTIASSPNKEETPQGVAAPAGSDLLDFHKPAPQQGTGPTPD